MLKGLGAPTVAGPDSFRYRDYDTAHLREMTEEWKPPAREVVCAWFGHFQACVPEYATDDRLAVLLGMGGEASHLLHEYRLGFAFVPYHVWHRFLILSGRAGQDIVPVLLNVDDSNG
ncbi:hypothetical protein HA45_21110 [Pantoea rodasii]|nr:hypothetical protein [Pantoea rodasii]ORM61187.1 hypothetical protein HA45_21110 [Pantoea rodasii]